MAKDRYGSEGRFGFDLGDKAPSRIYEPDRDKVRGDLNTILQSARGVTAESPRTVTGVNPVTSDGFCGLARSPAGRRAPTPAATYPQLS